MADTPQKSNDPAELLTGLMNDPKVMEKLSGIMADIQTVKAPTDGEASAESSLSDVLANPELMAKLPEVISVLRPMVSGTSPSNGPRDSQKNAADRRLALLYALKPYLSDRRCEAIDYIARMSKMGDMMKNLKW